MGSKKKSKANKLARMSEEERLRYLQHRAAMEEEAQRRKQELISTYLKTKLRHEEAFTRLNSAKISQQWRHILRQIKCKELKEDMETLKQKYEFVLNCKNKMIENLLQDFDRAEFQYSLQFKAHMEAVSKFLDIHRTRMADIHDWYSRQLHNILQKGDVNKRKFTTEIQSDVNVIKTAKDIDGNCGQDNLIKMKENFDERKNELQTKLFYKMTKLEEKYADELKELQQKYDVILNQYKKNTETKHAHYKILAEKDDFDSLQIIRHFEEIASYNLRIQQTKTELEEMESTHLHDINILEMERKKINEQLQKFQKSNNQNMIQDQTRLKVLINISNSVIKDLNELAKLGHKLVNLNENCDKIIKKKELSLPKITESNIQDDQVGISRNQVETGSSDPADNSKGSSFGKLQQFWKNYNDAKITNEILRNQKFDATSENKKLRKLLRFYMTSIRRSSSIPRKCGF